MKELSPDKAHWENIYRTKAEDQVSWFQRYPKTSMDFVEQFNLPPDAGIIDIGGGNSLFVDALLDKGYQNVWVLDISANALVKASQRLGVKASGVNWIIGDITRFQPPVQFDFWHDRAAFHFLTTEEEIQKYISIAGDAVKKDGYLTIGTFSENGPAKCSGLSVKQYCEASLTARFKTAFSKMNCIHEDHITPFDTVQNFLFCSFRRK